jgi:hypothetical protein
MKDTRGYSLPVPVADLLGEKTGDEDTPQGSPEPHRGILYFSDFLCEKEASSQPPIKSRIKIDPVRGAVARGALQDIEAPFASGEKVIFTGTISYIAKDVSQGNDIKAQIEKGLRWITSLGAERTSGFGRLIGVRVEAQERNLGFRQGTAVSGRSNIIGLVLRPRSPFCVAKRRTVGNLFESEDMLSGSVIRGALATTLKTILNRSGDVDGSIPQPWKELGEHFNAIRFTHAFPVASAQNEGVCLRPVFPPLSLVKTGEENQFFDVALRDGPGLIGQPPKAPLFSVDWKESDDVRKYFGWGHCNRELRVRTAVDRRSRRAAENQLFAYEMVVPDGHQWLGYANLSQIGDDDIAKKVESQLRALLEQRLRNIGKTKTTADVLTQNVQPLFPSSLTPLEPENRWVITLQTPAILCNPLELDEMSGKDELRQTYEKVWDDLSDSKLKLVRYFASQSLAGGWYLIRRFQPNRPYNPFLLSNAGSVFVLAATADIAEAKEVIETWLKNGLPLPPWAKKRYGDSWRSCPFLPADGFGEIAVNLPCHRDKYPPEEMWHAIR